MNGRVVLITVLVILLVVGVVAGVAYAYSVGQAQGWAWGLAQGAGQTDKVPAPTTGFLHRAATVFWRRSGVACD